MYYFLYRISDCVRKRGRKSIPTSTVDLLKAIFAVNRAAKRYRDAAQKHYRGGTHGFAGHSRKTKENLYLLKERGIVQAVRDQRLQFCGIHGGLALYRGEGYCFHSRLVPLSQAANAKIDGEAFFKESAPKEAGEARLKDAVATLSALSNSGEGFAQLSAPERFQKPAQREPWDDEETLDDLEEFIEESE